jgi:hypothetical protein
MKRLPLTVLQEIARVATRDQLSHWTDFGQQESLTLGTLWQDDLVIFELYIAGERPSDALVLTEAKVHAYSGELVQVRVFEENLKSLGSRRRSV